MKQIEELIAKLRDIGDSLRTTNLIRGREIHQLADDFAALAAQPAPPAPAPQPYLDNSANWNGAYPDESGISAVPVQADERPAGRSRL
jgi:hypothetical protein